VELAGIVDLSAPGCGTGSPCIDQTVFGPTVANDHWSATTYAPAPAFAWVVNFFTGSVAFDGKPFHTVVRGVRSGL
jgi:hypothetical protein